MHCYFDLFSRLLLQLPSSFQSLSIWQMIIQVPLSTLYWRYSRGSHFQPNNPISSNAGTMSSEYWGCHHHSAQRDCVPQSRTKRWQMALGFLFFLERAFFYSVCYTDTQSTPKDGMELLRIISVESRTCNCIPTVYVDYVYYKPFEKQYSVKMKLKQVNVQT